MRSATGGHRFAGHWLLAVALALLVLLAGCTSDDTTAADLGTGEAGATDAGPRSDADAADDAASDDACDVPAEPTLPEPTRHTPRWAFEPWISKDISDGPDTYAFVDGFISRDIPVGAVVLDSPWETQYNTFVPSPTRYPDFKKLVSDMHGRGVRVVLWITQMVNELSYDLETGGDKYKGASPNFAEGRRCGFYVMNGKTYPWWKGRGAGVDFFNAKARTWWHRQQDPLLDLGVDGWKLDFGESYIELPRLLTAKGIVPHQEYSEAYYRDFLAYGVKKRGREFVTMVRAYDKSYQFEGRFFARKEHAPVVWVGDNRRDDVGLIDALDHIFRSAAAGYVVVGSDIGGYLDHDDVDLSTTIPFDQDNFVRWLAVGALTPFMQLHGRGNLTPWTVPTKTTETVAAYRYWAWVHHELVPFFYSLAEQAYAGGKNLLRPIGEPKDWPGDYRFMLGDALLVAPLLDNTHKRDVALPAGARWYDFWMPGAAPIAGGTKLTGYDTSADQKRVPLFIRAGAIIPAHVASDVTGFGSKASKGHLTLLVYPAATQSTFELTDTDDKITTISAGIVAGVTTITLSRASQPVILRVRQDAAPTRVALGGQVLPMLSTAADFDNASRGYRYDAAAKHLWVKLPKDPSARVVTSR